VLAVFGFAAVLAAPGCRIWRDYGSEVPFGSSSETDDGAVPERDVADAGDTAARDIRETGHELDGAPGDAREAGLDCATERTPTRVSLEADGSQTSERAICRGHARWISLDLEAGERFEARVDYATEEATLSLGLFRRPTPEAPARVAAEPVWNDEGVRLQWLIRESGTYYLRLASAADVPATEEHIAYTRRLSRTTVADRVYWIGPEGDDGADGTRPSAAWQTWEHALDRLAPGDLLVARPGTWTDRPACGDQPAPCLSATDLPEIECGGDSEAHRQGTEEAPIRVAAERERRATLVNDTDNSALEIRGCRRWQVRGLTLRGTDGTTDSLPDLMEVVGSSNLRLQRLLVADSNASEWAPMTRIARSEQLVLRENAYYTFHLHGLLVRKSSDVRIERNYLHSREAEDADGYSTDRPERGESAIRVIRAEDVVVANTVVENVRIGYSVTAQGADSDFDATDRVELLGDAVRDAEIGFQLVSHADDECSSLDDADCLVERARVADGLAMEGADDSSQGFVFKGGRDSAITHSSSFGMTVGFKFNHGWPPGGPHAITEGVSVERSLAVGPGRVGFRAADEIDGWTVAHTNAHDYDRPYNLDPRPDDVTYQVDPELGGCRVTIPDDSPMQSKAGGRIGAEIVDRYHGGDRSDQKLWHQVSGRFPCGRRVPGVAGPDVPQSCHNVHRRLGVGSPGCPIP